MKLIGNKALLATAIIGLSSQLAIAEDVTAPELVTFTAGTPAKAAEVNGNFDGLKTYGEGLKGIIDAQAALISELETKVAELEANSSADEFDIAVYGDGELIGYANDQINLLTNYSPYIPLKTVYGMVAITQGYEYNAFSLNAFDPIRNEKAGENNWGIYFSDNTCTSYVYASGAGNGNPLLLTKVANTTDELLLFVTENNILHAPAGTVFNPDATAVYRLEEVYPDITACTQVEGFNEGFTIPVQLTDLKTTYTTLAVDGYILN